MKALNIVVAVIALALVAGACSHGGSSSSASTDSNAENAVSSAVSPVIPIPILTRIGAGGNHTCSIVKTGAVKCWGGNNNGQLGNDDSGANFQDRSADSPILASVIGIDGLTYERRAVQVSLGYDHTCAVLETGAVECWGSNVNGKLGNGNSGADFRDSSANSSIPVSVIGIDGTTPEKSAIQVSAGEAHTCAVLEDKTVQCWGSDYYGQLGNGDGTGGESDNSGDSPIPVSVIGIDGTTPENGDSTGDENDNLANNPIPVSVIGIDGSIPEKSAIQVSVGGSHTCAVLETRAIKCWGSNSGRQLENGDGTGDENDNLAHSPIPVSVIGIDGEGNARSAIQVSAGGGFTCAILGTGAIKCWGYNTLGRLGNGTTRRSLIPVSVIGINGKGNAKSAIQVSAGGNHTCAVLETGAIKCWGSDSGGQLGDDISEINGIPVPVTGIDGKGNARSAIQVSASRAHVFGHACATLETGTIKCWGSDYSGQLGTGTIGNVRSPGSVIGLDGLTFSTVIPIPISIRIGGGGNHTCSIVKTGAVKCWGKNSAGQLGNGDSGVNFYDYSADSSTPVSVIGIDGSTPAKSAIQVSAGKAHTCALLETGAVKCWGAGSSGQLGNGTTDESHTPVSVIGIDGSIPETSAIQVSSGGAHTCAVLENGAIKCWGRNSLGQLGNGDSTGDIFDNSADSFTPVSVIGIDGLTSEQSVIQVSLGGAHTCAILETGEIKCWGKNSDGELGNGTENSSQTPVSVIGIDGSTPEQSAIQVSAEIGFTNGESHTCALLETKALKCWGYNFSGQLGNSNRYNNSLIPVSVIGIDGSIPETSGIQVSAGRYHTCALLETGAVKCWGVGGRLGNVPTKTSHTPVSVIGIDGLTAETSAVQVSAGENHTCALLETNAIKCWGNNSTGQLGNGEILGRHIEFSAGSLTPVSVIGLDDSTP